MTTKKERSNQSSRDGQQSIRVLHGIIWDVPCRLCTAASFRIRSPCSNPPKTHRSSGNLQKTNRILTNISDPARWLPFLFFFSFLLFFNRSQQFVSLPIRLHSIAVPDFKAHTVQKCKPDNVCSFLSGSAVGLVASATQTVNFMAVRKNLH